MFDMILDFFRDLAFKAKDTLFVCGILLIKSFLFSMLLAIPSKYLFANLFKVEIDFFVVLCATFIINVIMVMVSESDGYIDNEEEDNE